MNRLHYWYCNREAWKRHVREELVPAAIDAVELGSDVLEVGPGFGPATEVLAARTERLTALELDSVLAGRLRERLDGRARIVQGDGTAMGDSTGRGLGFALLHIGDTRVVIDPAGLPDRLTRAGFDEVTVDAGRDAFSFRARRPR